MDYNHPLSTSQRRPPPPRLQQQQPQPYHHPRECLTSERKPVSFNLISSAAWKPKVVYPPQQSSSTPTPSAPVVTVKKGGKLQPQPLQLPPPLLPPEQQNHHKSEKKPDSSNLLAADYERKDDVHPADIVQRASQATSAPASTFGSCEGNMNPNQGGHKSSPEKQTIEKEKNNRSEVFNCNTNEPAKTTTTMNPVGQPGISSSMPPTPTVPSISPQPHVDPGPHSDAKPYGRMDETVNGLREQKKNNIAAGPTVPAKPPPTKDPGDDVVRPVRTVRPGARFVFVNEATAIV
ncbi:hypothetical protein Ancab_000836 [Ancistrocladus abbreviatus]